MALNNPKGCEADSSSSSSNHLSMYEEVTRLDDAEQNGEEEDRDVIKRGEDEEVGKKMEIRAHMCRFYLRMCRENLHIMCRENLHIMCRENLHMRM